jgi:endonuclease YncB( thermonuclease family)
MPTVTRLLGRVVTVLASALVFVGASPVPRGALAAPASGGPVELEGYVRAIQGDTFDARLNNRRIGIGVIGIQAPQGNTPCGKEATAYAQELVNDGAIIEEEAGLSSDGRNRLLYHVSTPDGRSVAQEMVAAGLARANGQGADHDRLAQLETAAQAAHRGCLWRSGGTP